VTPKAKYELHSVFEIKSAGLAFCALPEKLSPFLSDALFVTIDATAELDRCVSIAS